MRRPAATVAAALVALFAAAIAVGAWQFPRALEPRGAEAHTIVLNDLVDHGHDNVTNDWYSVSPRARVFTIPTGLRLAGPAGRRVLEASSRSLPVFPGSCYVLDIRAQVDRPGTSGAIFDENFTRRIERFVLPSGASSTVRVRFASGGLRRVSILLYGQERSRATLSRVGIVRVSPSRCR